MPSLGSDRIPYPLASPGFLRFMGVPRHKGVPLVRVIVEIGEEDNPRWGKRAITLYDIPSQIFATKHF